MGCTVQTFKGLARNCDANNGGIKCVYIANRADLTGNPTVSGGQITAIPMASGKKFKPFNFKKGAASFASTATIDDTTGTKYWTSVTSMNFARTDTAKRTEMVAIMEGEMAVIVLDNNGRYWFMGDEPSGYVAATNGGQNSGQNRSDANQYTIELTEERSTLPYEVSAAAASAVITDAVG